jgi:hypothetical protein
VGEAGLACWLLVGYARLSSTATKADGHVARAAPTPIKRQRWPLMAPIPVEKIMLALADGNGVRETYACSKSAPRRGLRFGSA